MFWCYFIYKNNLRKKRKKCFIDFNNAIFVSHPILTIDMSKPLRITNHIGCILWDFTNLHCCRVETKNWSISAFGFLQKSNSDMKYIDALEKWRNGSIGMGSPDPRFSKIACSSFLISAFSTRKWNVPRIVINVTCCYFLFWIIIRTICRKVGKSLGVRLNVYLCIPVLYLLWWKASELIIEAEYNSNIPQNSTL